MAVKKFGRNYILNIQTESGDTLTVAPPFTVEFDISRNTLTSANVASIRVFNLNQDNRSRVRFNITNLGQLRAVQLLAGYGNNIATIFDGNITQAWSVREGNNFITQIESMDGGFAFANSISNPPPFPSGTTQQTVIRTLMQDLTKHGVKIGAIGAFPGTLSRGNSYTGNTCNLLLDLTDRRFYIDNGKAFMLADNEVVAGPANTISAQSGLLNTPYREQSIVYFDMIFEPKLAMSQLITLDSGTADKTVAHALDNINGLYKVISLKHRGMISEAVCGDAITTVGLLQPLGFASFTEVPLQS